ncbi:MAG: hypothetical protein JJE25_08895 [Bacteroidia bacterium]|nr:hypothetical protein [Bacteroidia bacterium]
MSFRISCIFLLYSLNAFSQHDTLNNKTDSVRAATQANDSITNDERDLGDIQGKFFHTLFGKPDTIARQEKKLYKALLPYIGFTQATSFIAGIGLEASYYTDNPDSVNFSTINVSANYTANNQLFFPLRLNYWSKRNNFNFPVEFIYFFYPQRTYGLGGESTLENVTKLQYKYVLLRLPVLKRIARHFYAGAGYALDYRWQIEILEPPPGEDDFKKYGFTESSSSSGPTLNILYDSRHNIKNPQKGFYAYMVYRSNMTKLGSDENWEGLTVDVRKYFKLKEHSSNVLAFWSYNRLVLSGKPPYLDLPSTGRDPYFNQGRGYIQDRFRGKRLLAFESEYRFAISRKGLIGGVVFANVQTVAQGLHDRIDNLWPAAGLGVRIKLDKQSGTNLCIDFGIGKDSGSFFLSAGEVF